MSLARPADALPTFTHEGLVLVVREGEPMVSDEALAAAIQAPGDDVREVIKRNVDEGHIAAVPNLRSARRFTKAGKNRGSVTVHGYLLTEADALFIVTRSNTPRAVAATKVMIAAFIAARRQLAAPSAPKQLPPAPEAPPAPPSGVMTRSGVLDPRWTRMRARKVSILAVSAGIAHLVDAEDWPALATTMDTLVAWTRPSLDLDAPTDATTPASAAVRSRLLRELTMQVRALLLEEDWRALQIAAETIARFAAPLAARRAG